MESVRQDMDVPLAPGDHFAIDPDKAVTIVKGSWPGHAFSLRRLSRQDRYLSWLDDEPAGGQRLLVIQIAPAPFAQAHCCSCERADRLRKMTCHD
jgi:hypothetical protein